MFPTVPLPCMLPRRLTSKCGTATLGTATCDPLLKWLGRELLKVWQLTSLHPHPNVPIAYLGNRHNPLSLKSGRAREQNAGWNGCMWICVGQCHPLRGLDACTPCM